MGFDSCNCATRRATTSTSTPILSASSCCFSLSCGTHSCSGGSNRRIVTGYPSLSLKMPMKSRRWYGSSFAGAFISIERHPVALADLPPVRRRSFCCIVDIELLATHDATLAPASRHDGRMARLASGGRHNSLRHEHSSHILRTCFAPHEDNFFALGRHQLGFLGAEYGLAHRGAWHRVYSSGQFSFCEFGLRHRRIDHRVEKPFDILGLDALDGLYLGNEAFLRHIHGNLERRGWRALPHACLQHVELAFLDRKFHVLHVAVMLF